jgi:hypothetical protein
MRELQISNPHFALVSVLRPFRLPRVPRANFFYDKLKKKIAAAEGSELRYVVLPDRRLYLYGNTPVIIALRLFSRIAQQRYIFIKYIVSE